MNTKVTQGKALRWAAQALTVLVAAVAVNLYFKIGAPAASEAKPAAEAKPDAAPAGGAAKAAQPAAKG